MAQSKRKEKVNRMMLAHRSLVQILSLTALTGIFFAGENLHAQNDPGKGWVEGVLITDKGLPAWSNEYGNMNNMGGSITIRPKEGNGTKTDCDPSKGGFYTLRNLKPGIYEVFVDKTLQKDRNDLLHYRPQHMFGLVVEPDKRTVLNITVHEGEALEEIGKPDVAADKAIILADELARQRKDIEELKRQIDELKKK
jgi:hypothetical protein